MSEDKIKEALADMKEVSPPLDETDNSQSDQVSESSESEEDLGIEKEAAEQGWDKQRYLDNPESSMSAYAFLRYGKLQNQFSELEGRFRKKEQDFESQLSDVKELHKIQLEQKISALKVQAREAVEEADTDKYERTQNQIEELNKQATQINKPTPVVQEDPSLTQWKSNNPWVEDESDPRCHAARGLWDTYVAQHPHATVEQALAYLDSRIKETFNNGHHNPRRDMPGLTESTPKIAKKRNRSLNMNDLTQEERDMWRQTGHLFWGDDEKGQQRFLTAVANSRN